MKKRPLDDSDITGMFRTMQREDRDQAPSFDRIWAAAEHDQRRHRRKVLFRYAVAAAVLIMVSVSYLALTERQTSPELALSISDWQSPTQRLLTVPDLIEVPHSVPVSEWQSPTGGLLGQGGTTNQ